MTKRFALLHVFKEYTNYVPTSDKDAARRLTIVRPRDEKPWAYLTLRDYTEQQLTLEQAEALLHCNS